MAAAKSGVPASNLCGGSFQVLWKKSTLEIMSPPAVKGRHVREHFAPPVEDAAAGGTAEFVAGEGQEIAADFLHIDGPVPGALGGIDQRDNAAAAGAGAQLGHGIDRAQRVGNVGEREELDGAVQQPSKPRQVQQPVVAGDRHVGQLGAGAFGQQLPGDDVAVMLHFRQQYGVAGS